MTASPYGSSAGDTARVAWDAARRYLEGSASLGQRSYADGSTTLQGGLEAALFLQEALFQSSQALLATMLQASSFWINQTAEIVLNSQIAAAGVIGAALEMAGSLQDGEAERSG